MGDLNINSCETTKNTQNYLSDLCDTFSLTNIVKGKTFFKLSLKTASAGIPV